MGWIPYRCVSSSYPYKTSVFLFLLCLFLFSKIILSCLFRLIKEFDRKPKDLEGRNDPDANKMLNDKKKVNGVLLSSFLVSLRYYRFLPKF